MKIKRCKERERERLPHRAFSSVIKAYLKGTDIDLPADSFTDE